MARNRQKITDRTEQTGENRQDGSDRREQTGRNRQDGTDRMEQTGRNRQDGTDRTEQTGRNRQERTFNIEDTPLVLIIIFISFLFQPKKMESLLQWWWKDTLHVHTAAATAVGVPAAMVVERHPARPYFQLRKDTLHIPTAGGENTLCTSILLLVESHTARVNVHTYIPYHIQLNKIKSCVLTTSLFFYYVLIMLIVNYC
jgi:hypothetical protein